MIVNGATHEVYGKYAAYVSPSSVQVRAFWATKGSKRVKRLKIERQALIVHALYKSGMIRWLGQAIATRVRVHKTDVRIYYTSANEPLGEV